MQVFKSRVVCLVIIPSNTPTNENERAWNRGHYCLDAPGRKTVTVLGLEVAPLLLVVPVQVLVAAGRPACSAAEWVPPHVLHACLNLQES